MGGLVEEEAEGAGGEVGASLPPTSTPRVYHAHRLVVAGYASPRCAGRLLARLPWLVWLLLLQSPCCCSSGGCRLPRPHGVDVKPPFSNCVMGCGWTLTLVVVEFPLCSSVRSLFVHPPIASTPLLHPCAHHPLPIAVDGTRQHIVAVGLTVDDLLTSVRAATRWAGGGDGGGAPNPFTTLRRERLAAIASEVTPGGDAAARP